MVTIGYDERIISQIWVFFYQGMKLTFGYKCDTLKKIRIVAGGLDGVEKVKPDP